MMKITPEWLRESDFSDFQINWFISQDETDAIKLVKKLLLKGSISLPDVAIEQDRALSAALDLANNFLARIMNEKQLVKYTVYAVEQVLPYFEKDFPEEDDPPELFRLTKDYLRFARENLIKQEEIYRKDILQITCRLHSHAEKATNILLINHATSLTAYSVIYTSHQPLHPVSHKVMRSNTIYIINFLVSYFNDRGQRDKIFTRVIVHGLEILGRDTF